MPEVLQRAETKPEHERLVAALADRTSSPIDAEVDEGVHCE
jgi:hypothetical protein